jgi:hypothetical protein
MRHLLIAAALMFTGAAHAEIITTTCETYYRCMTIISPSLPASPRIIKGPDQPENAQWLAFCKPTTVVDKYGAERYLYAHPGCEFGRKE